MLHTKEPAEARVHSMAKARQILLVLLHRAELFVNAENFSIVSLDRKSKKHRISIIHSFNKHLLNINSTV